MDFAVFNLPGIEQSGPLPEWHIIISIRTPNEHEVAKIPVMDRTLGFLRMAFYDIVEWDPVKDPQVDPALLFNEDMALQIIEFAVTAKRDPRLQLVVAHCIGGASRSPAVIAGLMRTVWNEDDSEVRNSHPNYNTRVYEGILKAWDRHLLRERLLGR